MNSRYMRGLLENDPGTIYVFVTAYIPVGSMTVGPDTGRFQSQSLSPRASAMV